MLRQQACRGQSVRAEEPPDSPSFNRSPLRVGLCSTSQGVTRRCLAKGTTKNLTVRQALVCQLVVERRRRARQVKVKRGTHTLSGSAVHNEPRINRDEEHLKNNSRSSYLRLSTALHRRTHRVARLQSTCHIPEEPRVTTTTQNRPTTLKGLTTQPVHTHLIQTITSHQVSASEWGCTSTDTSIRYQQQYYKHLLVRVIMSVLVLVPITI